MNKDKVFELVEDKLIKYFSVLPKNATKMQIYKALALVTRDILLRKKQEFSKKVAGQKKAYYLCMEFLVGRNLKNSLFNLGLEQAARQALKVIGFNLDEIYELEKDPGLGNGGLGRLAACYMDSLASQDYPATGFSIRYDYGLFKQKIVENQQVELADNWLDTGEVFLMPRSDKAFVVRLFGDIESELINGEYKYTHKNGEEIEATAYDLMIPGFESKAVTNLRLWHATATGVDMHHFSQGDYIAAMQRKTRAEVISKILYPSDDHESGKTLRLSQQYFLVSASLQSIVKDYLATNASLDDFSEKVAIHINDTHPALAIPELMRILIDEHNCSWDFAWDTTKKCMAYTNHTVLVEALETWSEHLIKALLPRIYMLLLEIDRRHIEELNNRGRGDIQERTGIFWHGAVKMANLCAIGAHTINGVSALHSDIIKETIFSDFYSLYPEKFTNVTNGIAYRRWLCQANPKLTEFLVSLIGKGFIKDAAELKKLHKFTGQGQVLEGLAKIKLENKKALAKFLKEDSGIVVNPNSRFDVQVKRLHEYKRQLLNILKIIHEYLIMQDDPNKSVTPQTFIFGAKAAGGYTHAKRIIQLINCIKAEIHKNPKIREKLDIVFVENYCVSKAERIFPASEVSQQISLAGKEASGTGNMKFMLNGAITLGTDDGANVEIREAVGDDNIFTFGMSKHEVADRWHEGYSSAAIYSKSPVIRRIIEALKAGFAGESFLDIANYLIIGDHHVADPYMCLADFDDYIRAGAALDKAYQDEALFNKMSLINIAEAGRFSSDRSIKEYADNIWGLKKAK